MMDAVFAVKCLSRGTVLFHGVRLGAPVTGAEDARTSPMWFTTNREVARIYGGGLDERVDTFSTRRRSRLAYFASPREAVLHISGLNYDGGRLANTVCGQGYDGYWVDGVQHFGGRYSRYLAPDVLICTPNRIVRRSKAR